MACTVSGNFAFIVFIPGRRGPCKEARHIAQNRSCKKGTAMQAKKAAHVGIKAGIVALTLLLLPPCPGRAEGTEEQNPRVYSMEPVTVTAQKQEEAAQETPLSLVVLDETELQDRMIETVDDFIDLVPNMYSFDTGTLGENLISMRGITAPTMARSTSTGMFIDGVPVLSSFGYSSGLLDVERIEVLRGPQGTTYGKSTEAGAVSIVTVKPGNTFTGKLVGDGGSMLSSKDGDKFVGSLGASLMGPIVRDALYFSVSGKMEHKEGFIKNTTTRKAENERDNYFGRAALRWTPTESLDINLALTRESMTRWGGSDNAAGGPYREVASDLRSKQDADVDMQSLSIAYDITDTITVTSISARRNAKGVISRDMDYSAVEFFHGFIDAEQESYSQELRLNGTHGDWEWLVGLYVDREDMDYKQRTESIFPGYITEVNTSYNGNCYAGFVSLGYNLTEKLKLIGGLRYEYQKLKFKSTLLDERLEESWTNVAPKAGVQYRFTPEIMGYATVSQGYRPGGFNERSFDTRYSEYDPEKLWSYEIGLKSTLLDNRLLVNVAAFYMDISDKQVEEQVSTIENYLTNAGRATSMGVELDVTAVVMDGLMLNAGFGYLHAEFDDFKDISGDYKGNKLPYAPKYTFNTGMQYRAENGLFLQADLVGYGKTYFDKTNEGHRDAYVLVNAKIGYETEHFDVYLYGKNIFDTKHDIKNWNGMDIYAEPGEMGVQLVARF